MPFDRHVDNLQDSLPSRRSRKFITSGAHSIDRWRQMPLEKKLGGIENWGKYFFGGKLPKNA